MVEKQTVKHKKYLKLGGGGEYLSIEFNKFLRRHGNQRQFSCSIQHNKMVLLSIKIGILHKLREP